MSHIFCQKEPKNETKPQSKSFHHINLHELTNALKRLQKYEAVIPHLSLKYSLGLFTQKND